MGKSRSGQSTTKIRDELKINKRYNSEIDNKIKNEDLIENEQNFYKKKESNELYSNFDLNYSYNCYGNYVKELNNFSPINSTI